MNVQTEHLENHTARLTVEVDVARLNEAKQKAARALSRQVNIPGFRKGKVPYNVLVRYVGEGSIIEEAVEELGQEIYREALDSAKVEPYGAGALEDFKLDAPNPVFTFTVPLQPVVELGDYRAVRLEYTPPTVEDKDVDAAMRRLQQDHALAEESQRPAEMGNRVTIDIHSEYVDAHDHEGHDHEEGEGEDEESEAEHTHDHDHDHTFIHQHDAAIVLSEEEDEAPILPGFSKALEGANVNDTVEFELTVPDDKDDYGEDAGRRVKFSVTVKKIENITLPALNDEFAARVTADERQEDEEPLTLLQLRMRMRENLEKAMLDRAQSEYAERVLDAVVKGATIKFPEEMVEDQIEGMIREFENDLRRQGITLDYYTRVTGRTNDDLANDFRDSARRIVQRSLVIRELLTAEKINITEDDVQEEVRKFASQLGPQADAIIEMFSGGQLRDNIRSNLLQNRMMERLGAIARGEAPDLDAEPEPVEAGDAAEEDTQNESSVEEAASTPEASNTEQESAG